MLGCVCVNVVTLPAVGVRSIAVIVSVCLSVVCVFACLSVHLCISKAICPNITKFLCTTCSVTVAQYSSDGDVMQCCSCTSSSMDDVMFAYNRESE